MFLKFSGFLNTRVPQPSEKIQYSFLKNFPKKGKTDLFLVNLDIQLYITFKAQRAEQDLNKSAKVRDETFAG